MQAFRGASRLKTISLYDRPCSDDHVPKEGVELVGMVDGSLGDQHDCRGSWDVF